ncbi:MAG: metallophosphoesterase [Phycisphaerae bacterium]
MFSLILTAGVALMSAYFFWRFRAAFPRLGRGHLAVVGVLLVLATARLWGRAVGRLGLETLGEAAGIVLMIWMVLLFWFLWAGLALQAWNVLVKVGSKRLPALQAVRLGPRRQFAVAAVLIAGASTWGWFEARHVSTSHLTVEVDSLPDGRRSLRIAQISDVHVGSFQSRQRLRAAIRLLRDLEPDLIVCTGDLVDGRIEKVGPLAEELGTVDAPLGKYAVLGNHEFYAGLEDSMAFLRTAGFRVLRQERVSPLPGLQIAGVDDPAARRRGLQPRLNEQAVLPPQGDPNVVVLLKHRPDVDAGSRGRFDLQLSGHTHGGQVFPFGLLTKLAHEYCTGRHDLPGGSTLYVSRGTGTWGPPLRVGSPPEVTLIELRAKR